jgi:hypothetical protein
MAMEKTGAPPQPQMGKVLHPWPSAVLVYKAEEGGFVPQPRLSEATCPACRGKMTKFPDGKLLCEQCPAKKGEIL